MARWVRRMREVPGYEERFAAHLETLGSRPSPYRVKRLALIMFKHHIPIGGVRSHPWPLSPYDWSHYGQSVRRYMLDTYGDDRP